LEESVGEQRGIPLPYFQRRRRATGKQEQPVKKAGPEPVPGLRAVTIKSK
jgi:hypothetical protein